MKLNFERLITKIIGYFLIIPATAGVIMCIYEVIDFKDDHYFKDYGDKLYKTQAFYVFFGETSTYIFFGLIAIAGVYLIKDKK